jgi:hypothetical protein
MAVLLVLMPLLSQAQAHWPAPLTETAGGEMPCHQPPASQQDDACQHCSDGALAMNCDCCNQATPHNLPGFEPPLVVSRTIASLDTASPATGLPYPPTAKFYRPPRQRLI